MTSLVLHPRHSSLALIGCCAVFAALGAGRPMLAIGIGCASAFTLAMLRIYVAQMDTGRRL